MATHEYEPTPAELEWARAALASVRNGGTLTLPGPRMLWRVNHEKKLVILINSDRLDTRIGRETYLRVKTVFEKLDYTVAPA